METPKPHPHAELIKVWADGAIIQFYCKGSEKWIDCLDNQPAWKKEFQYRIKPEESEKTEKWKPSYKERYFYIELGEDIQHTKWEGSYADYQRLELGNCFENREGAIIAYNRVEAVLKGKESEEAKTLRKENEEPEQLLLSKGEKALIKALRTYAIERSYCPYEGRILGVNYDDEDVVSLSIGIKLKRPHSTPVDIAAAIDRIKAEQTAAAEMYHSLAS